MKKPKIFIYNLCIFEGRRQSHRRVLDTIVIAMARSPSLLRAV
jgi:hypothetical protein